MSAEQQSPETGRALDARVRDAIFGPWDESRCRVCGWPIVPHGERGCWSDNCSMRFPHDENRHTQRADEPRPYSTDIAAAWEVVEKMRDFAPRYANLSLVAYCYNRTYATFDADAFPEYTTATWVEANGPHATPRAICLAALKAVAGVSIASSR